MGAEDPKGSLVSFLDSLESARGPARLTCQWWADQDDQVREAVTRNVARVGHTLVARKLRDAGYRVTYPDIKLHAEGKCRCQRDG